MNVEAQDGGGERTAINTCAGLWVVRRLSNGFIRGLPHRMFVVLTLRLLPATDMRIEGLSVFPVFASQYLRLQSSTATVTPHDLDFV